MRTKSVNAKINERVILDGDPNHVGTIVAVGKSMAKVLWDSGAVGFVENLNGRVSRQPVSTLTNTVRARRAQP